MDWKLIQLMLRDHIGGKTKYSTVLTLKNTIEKFGKETEFEEIKVILRPIFKELKSALDGRVEKRGVISDERFTQIVDQTLMLIQSYYFGNRFKN